MCLQCSYGVSLDAHIHGRPLGALLGLACAGVALACAPSAIGDTATPPALPRGTAVATLEQCATAAAPQTERSATFTGEMAATAGTLRMEMRIELEELPDGEQRYHTVIAPGLGVWQRSNVGVKSFTHIQQFTNLSAPALYRGAIHFRWLNAKGRMIKSEELHTAGCEQPASG